MHSSTITGVLATVALFAAPALARGPWAGPINMQEACEWQINGASKASRPGNGNAWDWYCAWNGLKYPIDTNRYCRDKYGNNASSDPQGGGAWDWGCYYP